jgi:hypothetical protein
MDHFMKIRIALGLCAALGAGFTSLGAADNPAQAAARAALEHKLNQPANPQIRSLPATNTPPAAMVEQSPASAISVTEMVPETAVTPQTAPVATTPAAAPVAVAPTPIAPVAVAPAAVSPAAITPTVVSPIAVAPAAVAPAAVPPALSPLLLSLVLIAFLLIALVIVLLLILKLRALKLLLLKHPTVVARAAAAPAAVPRTVAVPNQFRPAVAAATPSPAPTSAAPKAAISAIVSPAAAAPVRIQPVVTGTTPKPSPAPPAVAAPAFVTPNEIQRAVVAATPKPDPAPTTTKRPVPRRKRVRQPNGAENEVDLPKIEWATAKGERKRPSRAGATRSREPSNK